MSKDLYTVNTVEIRGQSYVPLHEVSDIAARAYQLGERIAQTKAECAVDESWEKNR